MFSHFFSSIGSGLFPSVVRIIIILMPIVVPFILLCIFWIFRLRLVQMKYIETKDPRLLEIKLPKEILKSPAGMEIFFSYLGIGAAATYYDAFFEGETRPWFSCEIASIEGEVKFFIWCSQERQRNMVEAQLYAQYPNIEIYDVTENDYTKNFYFNPEKYSMRGVQYKLGKPDPYPIKTYIDYGLDEDPKDEYKIDPLTAVLEFWGTMKKGENIWMQIMLRKHEKETWKHGVWSSDKDLKKETEKAIEEIRAAATPKPKNKDDKFQFPNPTKGQTETIAALERVASKPPFDCMIRTIYIAEKSVFNISTRSALSGILKQYGTNHLNSFKRGFASTVSDLRKDLAKFLPFLPVLFIGDIFALEIYICSIKKHNEATTAKYEKEMLHAYKLRSFFEWPYKDYKDKPFILTTEELATVFHFPSGIVSQTPTLERVESKKSEAPANLPI